MQRTYYATFQVGERDGWRPPLEDVFQACGAWAVRNHEGFRDSEGLPEPFSEPGRHQIEGNTDLVIRRGEIDGCEAFGLRLESITGNEFPLSMWAEVVGAHDDGGPRVAASLWAGHAEETLHAVWTPPKRPALVRDLIHRFGAFVDVQLTDRAEDCPTSDVPELARFLLSHERLLPVAVISPGDTGRPLVSPHGLAVELAALAHVYVLDGRLGEDRLIDAIGDDFGCYGGAVRIYWPGLGPDDDPRRHRYWPAFKLRDLGGRATSEILSYVTESSLYRTPPRILRWENLERDRVHQVDEAGREVERLRKKVELLEDEVGELYEERDRWKRWYEDATEVVEERGATEPLPHERPESLADAVAWVGERYPDRIAFALNSRSEVDENPFEDPEMARRALVALATTYRDARTGDEPCSDLAGAIYRVSGFTYRTHQSDSTMGMFPQDYVTRWEGEKIELPEHLAKGTGRQARHALRIGFAFHKESGKVVVGYIGQHQRTRTS